MKSEELTAAVRARNLVEDGELVEDGRAGSLVIDEVPVDAVFEDLDEAFQLFERDGQLIEPNRPSLRGVVSKDLAESSPSREISTPIPSRELTSLAITTVYFERSNFMWIAPSPRRRNENGGPREEPAVNFVID